MKKVLSILALLAVCTFAAVSVQAQRDVHYGDGHLAFDNEDCVFRCIGSPFDCVT